MLKEEFMFIGAAARMSELLYLALHNRKLAAEDKSHSTFAAVYKGEKGRCGNTVAWDAKAMCVVKKPSEKLVAISIDGEVFTFAAGKETAEKIDHKLHSITDLKTIGGHAYATGVCRQVFKRVGEGKWEPMHAPTSFHIKELLGFTSIAGFSENDIYTSGYKGEIWHYDGKKWKQIDSPVNTDLNAIVCGEDGLVYLGGDNGVLVRGREDKWETINKDGYTGNIWGLQWFNEKLYASTMEKVLVLKGDNFEAVKMGKDIPDTCYFLTSAEGVMWSVGTDDIFSFDGKKWMRIE